MSAKKQQLPIQFMIYASEDMPTTQASTWLWKNVCDDFLRQDTSELLQPHILTHIIAKESVFIGVSRFINTFW